MDKENQPVALAGLILAIGIYLCGFLSAKGFIPEAILALSISFILVVVIAVKTTK